jgi:hypothetical protein
MLKADDRVHFTHLKNMSDSPAHYLASLEETWDSPSFKFGRLIHYLILGGGNFVVWEHGDRKGKLWDAFKAEHDDREIFKRSEVDEARRIAHAVRTHPLVNELGLLEGEHEKLIDWTNDGVPFRSHLDVIGRGRNHRRHVCDVKTTQCSKPERFYWEAKRYGYHAQLATYQDAAAAIKLPCDDAYIIAVEKQLPFAVTVFQLTPSLLLEGRKLAATWLQRLKVCLESNEWPTYTQSVVPMDVVADDKFTLIMPDGSEVAA